MKQSGTLLVIDDEHDIGDILVDIFSPIFDKVIYCDNAIEAIGVLKSTDVKIILSDYNMPKMSGSDLMVKMKSMGLHTPVVFLTGYASKEFAISAIRLGVSDIIEKPFDADSLVQSIDRVIEIEKRKKNAFSGDEEASSRDLKMIGLLQVVNNNKKVG